MLIEINIENISRDWWNFLHLDSQMWLMMKYGYDKPFDPKRVRVDEMVKMYKAEH